MTPTDTVAKTLELNDSIVQMALEGLTDEDLLKQPHPDCNPIGWLLWHQARTEDNILSRFSGKPAVWTRANGTSGSRPPAAPRTAASGTPLSK